MLHSWESQPASSLQESSVCSSEREHCKCAESKTGKIDVGQNLDHRTSELQPYKLSYIPLQMPR